MNIFYNIQYNIILYKYNHNMNESPIDSQNINKYAANFTILPSKYSQWYSMLSEQYIPYYQTPEIYQQWYNYFQNYQQQANMNQYGYKNQNANSGHYMHLNQPVNAQLQKKKKLSRNQKRKLKKKQFQEEYEKQKRQIGKWVDLQRKDLVQGLKKIQQQQKKIKQKRKQKLSHLIQIHKQVYKHFLKKNKGKVQKRKQEIGNFRKKKKKPSHIKRMKQLYQELTNNVFNKGINTLLSNKQMITHEKIKQQVQIAQKKQVQQDDDEDFVTESEDEDNTQIQINKKQTQLQKIHKLQIKNHLKNTSKNKMQKQQIQQKSKQQKTHNQTILNKAGQNPPNNVVDKQHRVIQYKHVGKLNGYIYNGIQLRQWVDHIPSAELQDIVLRFINRLAYKQAIKKVNQPQKARKIIIAGLHECRRTLWTKLDKKKSKLLIVALNIERNNLERGTDDQIQQLLIYAQQAKVPIIHISTRSKIGRAFTGKFGPRITTVSVINYQGYEDMMDVIMQRWNEVKKIYNQTNRYCFKL